MVGGLNEMVHTERGSGVGGRGPGVRDWSIRTYPTYLRTSVLPHLRLPLLFVLFKLSVEGFAAYSEYCGCACLVAARVCERLFDQSPLDGFHRSPEIYLNSHPLIEFGRGEHAFGKIVGQ